MYIGRKDISTGRQARQGTRPNRVRVRGNGTVVSNNTMCVWYVRDR